MDLDTIFASRHSIRDYEKKEIPFNLLAEVIDSTRGAPSAGNMQNWVLIVVQDKKMMNTLAQSCLDQYWISQSGALIVVCYDDRNAKALFPKDYQEFSIQNTAIVSIYMMLKATELGLGACWVNIEKKENVSINLKLPSYITPSHILALGYSKGMHKKTSKLDPKVVTYFESYGIKKRDTSIFPIKKQIEKIKKKLKSKN